ncbi:MAG: endoribonuclease YicC domain-containing protein, partial [Bacteroidota bacterium]
DIHEERVRLKTHLDYFLKVMNEKISNGKKLGFIAQEIGREINTIGSKANDAEIQKHVVMMKEELEKIKEQLNNVL